MIPKIIHYCWFGGNELPREAKKCIKSWKKYCRGYELVRWNESNFDISSAPLYVRQAYELKKWAYVTDYIRLVVVYENGGIYLDTDVEIVKPLDPLLNHKAYFGFENKKLVNTGIGFGAEKGTTVLREIMEQYKDIGFILPDGTIDSTPCPDRNTEVFVNRGLRQDGTMQTLGDDIVVYPAEYFSPKSYFDGVIRSTENTYSVHHFAASWLSEEKSKKLQERWKREQKEARQNARRVKQRAFAVRILGENLVQKIRGTGRDNK